MGLVTYHFATRDALLAATYVTLSAGNAGEIAALARDVIDRGESVDEVMADHFELMLTTRRTAQSALFQLLLFAARQAIEDDLPELAEEPRKAQGRIVAVIRPYTSSDDDARDLATALIGYTFMTLSTGDRLGAGLVPSGGRRPGAVDPRMPVRRHPPPRRRLLVQGPDPRG